MSKQNKVEVKEFWNRNINQFNQLNRDDVGSRDLKAMLLFGKVADRLVAND